MIGGGGASPFGGNTFDYSAYASNNVIVNLRMNQASGVGGGVWNIQNVIGGNTLPGGPPGLYNVLVGDGGNILIGGTGRRNLLIAGPLGRAPSSLIGGNDDDILIGGSTAWDTDPNWRVAFTSLMAEWTRLDLDYFQRVNHIIGGGGLNGSYVLNPQTVFNNGGGNVLVGHKYGFANRDLYFDNPGLGDRDDSIQGWEVPPILI